MLTDADCHVSVEVFGLPPQFLNGFLRIDELVRLRVLERELFFPVSTLRSPFVDLRAVVF